MKEFEPLEKTINYIFKDKELLSKALTHKSYKKPYSNERLEFLGDAVLNLTVGEYLYEKFPNSNEGELSKMRAGLVNEKSFQVLANRINLGSFILLSNSEERNQGRKKASILSDAFEAIMGAVFLESGIQEVKKIALSLIEQEYEKISLDYLSHDYKTSLQEITQALYAQIPEYKLEKEIGPDHEKSFEVSIWIDGKCYSKATGKSKKIAQQAVAKIALDKINNGQ
ncbi:MAG: ribonuclease III [Epsilonproteobacteria bacterium]|nr:MAG: ribonuclease III [Campylobacterota bacterium]